MFRVEHTDGELEISIEDVDVEGVFTDALLALGDAFSDATAESGAPATHEVTLQAADMPGLLAAWIAELVRLAEREDFVPERVARLHLADRSIRASVAGERALPRDLVAGVASERVGMRREEDGTYSAAVVLRVRS